MRRVIVAALAVILAGAALRPALANDTQAGYYYPKPKSTETYQARVATLPDSDRSRRIGFVTGIAKEIVATLTASARTTQFFQQNSIAEYATFLDFLKLLGFKQVTITDGVAFAHQILIE